MQSKADGLVLLVNIHSGASAGLGKMQSRLLFQLIVPEKTQALSVAGKEGGLWLEVSGFRARR